MSFAEAFATKFAEDLAVAETVKDKVIAERNIVLASCMAAYEMKRPDLSKIFYEQALVDAGAQPTGLLPTDEWQDCVRQVAANAYPISTDPDEILATISTGNPYLDISVASHPSARA